VVKLTVVLVATRTSLLARTGAPAGTLERDAATLSDWARGAGRRRSLCPGVRCSCRAVDVALPHRAS